MLEKEVPVETHAGQCLNETGQLPATMTFRFAKDSFERRQEPLMPLNAIHEPSGALERQRNFLHCFPG